MTMGNTIMKIHNRADYETVKGTYMQSHTMSRDANSYIKSIVFPESGEARARKVVSRSNARATGKYPSWKMQRSMQWESVNELHAFRLLDCDPGVIRFKEQPCRIEYVGVDGLHRHFPDILVETRVCKELWEVKPLAQAMRPEVSLRTELLLRELP